MKKLLVVCLGVLLLVSPALAGPYPPDTFAVAKTVGDPKTGAFYQFSTSAGRYTIRYDGMGELLGIGRKRVFYLKVGAKGRINRVYHLEHDGDLFFFYEVHDGTSSWAYLARMEHPITKQKWVTPVPASNVVPMLQGELVIIGNTEISLDGRIVKPEQD